MAEKERFIEIFRSTVKRDGADKLLKWLEESDFFEAPASTRHHLAEPGGLCRHTLHVYDRLVWLADGRYSDETIAIAALLHDICKVNFYKLDWKNQKTYDEAKVQAADPFQRKHDAAGDFIWETVPCYTIDDRIVLGHGEKSALIAMSFMRLTLEEIQAIRYHMGAWNAEEARDAGKCFERNRLAFLLHIADEFATFMDESEA